MEIGRKMNIIRWKFHNALKENSIPISRWLFANFCMCLIKKGLSMETMRRKIFDLWNKIGKWCR